MGYDLNKLYEGPRSERRAKKRRVNMVLNVLIGIVILLIIFFGAKLIIGDKPSEKASSNEKQTETNDVIEQPEETEETITDVADETENNDSIKEDDDTKPEETEETKDPDSNENAVVTEGDGESNITRTIENPDWTPIGTAQTEPHTVNYDKGSNDRNEMEKAVSYATGLDQSNMIVWWIGRNGENSVYITASSSDNQEIYRVYLDWVSNQGWKPVKVEELVENDSETYQKRQKEKQEINSEE